MTPTCSIGEALKPAGPATADLVAQAVRERWLFCAGPLKPLMVVSKDALREKYPYGAVKHPSRNEWQPISDPKLIATTTLKTLSPDQLREAVTVKGFTVCEKHLALVAGAIPAANIANGERYPEVEPPKLRLSDVLRVDERCDHNCIPLKKLWRSGWVCVRCDRFFQAVPPRTGIVPHPALSEAMEWAERLGS